MISKSAGEFMYLKMALGDAMAFLFSWQSGILTSPAGEAAISLVCAEYILVPFYDDGCGEPPLIQRKILASVLIGK